MFPTVVAFADECRKVFGDGVKLVHAKENGYEIGQSSLREGDVVVNGKDMVIESMAEPDAVKAKDLRRAK